MTTNILIDISMKKDQNIDDERKNKNCTQRTNATKEWSRRTKS